MQPPTEPTTPGPRDTVDELYRRHHHELQQSVAGAVRAPRELIEDACQTAWAIMLRAQPPCHRFGWLRAVAIHEAYRLLAIDRRQATLATTRPATAQRQPRADQRSLDDALEARDALRRLATLPERERTDLALQIAGYSYKEIQARTPRRTWTNVNKSLVRARARLRRCQP
jgi:DNA-directed RNA polymerase specialized sigma24 family protein